MTEQTPTPWKLSDDGIIWAGDVVVINLEEGGMSYKDAAFIVRAVNAYDELLSTLKMALKWGEEEIRQEYSGTSQLADKLKELDFIMKAIAKAEGK